MITLITQVHAVALIDIVVVGGATALPFEDIGHFWILCEVDLWGVDLWEVVGALLVGDDDDDDEDDNGGRRRRGRKGGFNRNSEAGKKKKESKHASSFSSLTMSLNLITPPHLNDSPESSNFSAIHIKKPLILPSFLPYTTHKPKTPHTYIHNSKPQNR